MKVCKKVYNRKVRKLQKKMEETLNIPKTYNYILSEENRKNRIRYFTEGFENMPFRKEEIHS